MPRPWVSNTWSMWSRFLGVVLIAQLICGVVTLPEVWALVFHVNEATGSDGNTAAQAQNPLTPWKSLTKALTDGTPTSGDTIEVAAGTYSAGTTTEAYPLALKSGVAVHGAGKGVSILSAPVGTKVFETQNTNLASNTTLSGFTLTHDATDTASSLLSLSISDSTTAYTMEPKIQGNEFKVAGRGINLWVRGNVGHVMKPEISGNNDFSQLTNQGVRLAVDSLAIGGAASPLIDGNTFTLTGSAAAIEISASSFNGTVAPIVSHNSITGGDRGIDVAVTQSESTLVGVMAPNIFNNTIGGTSGDAIHMQLTAESGSEQSIQFSPTINNNTITNPGDDGIALVLTELTEESSNALQLDATIIGNTISGAAGDGIDLEATSWEAITQVDVNVMVANNSVTSVGGIGIAVEFTGEFSETASGSLDFRIVGNVVDGAEGDGILFESSDWGPAVDLTHSATLSGNTVSGAAFDGIDVFLSEHSELSGDSVTIRDNVLGTSTVGAGNLVGLRIQNEDRDPNPILVSCNTVTGNSEHGVVQESPSFGSAPPADYGGGNLSSPGRNIFSGNGASPTFFDFVNEHTAQAKAENNWWNSADPTPRVTGSVDFLPLFNDPGPFPGPPPSVLAAATLTSALTVDVPPAGPSIGDTFEFTATLTNSGDCGCAAPDLEVTTPANAQLIAGSVVSDAGVVLEADPDVKVALGGAFGPGDTVTITWQLEALSGDELVVQGEAGCEQMTGGFTLTEDADSGGPTVIPLGRISVVEIPTLDRRGLIALLLFIIGIGIAVLRRRRAAGAAMLVLLLGLPAAQAAPGAAPAQGGVQASPAPRLERPETVHQAKTLQRASVEAGKGGEVRLTFTDGTSLVAPRAAVEARDGRAAAKDRPSAEARRESSDADRRAERARRDARRKSEDDLSVLEPGQALMVKVKKSADGRVERVKIQIFDSLDEAMAELKKKEDRQAEKAAKATARETAKATASAPPAAPR